MTKLFGRMTRGLLPWWPDAPPAGGDYEAGEAHVDGARLADGECRWSASLGRPAQPDAPADFEDTRPLCVRPSAASLQFAPQAA